MNRLATEASPYLRQHRDNPVEWYPWGEEAFALARSEDRPILLSVGYSACHWCHVMAHESFEDPEVARVMNELFVNVKVDREERPDVDAVYMEAVQAMTGQGGWPMTVFLTPDGRPFFGGTYFPKQPQYGRPGLVQLLRAVDEAWQERRSELMGQADQLAAAVRARTELPPASDGVAIGPELLSRAYAALRAGFDPEWGGFGRAPKFPQTMNLELLLRAYAAGVGDGPREMVETSLAAMASGGIYDHLGGGFARYSVDAFWMVPHFEKMLYDQALLARIYLHGWQVTRQPGFRQVLDETVGYVLRDLRAPEGGLYSAEDADSEGEEGKFYVWRQDEIEEVLGPELAPAAIEHWGITKAGNFEGANILHLPRRGELVRDEQLERARQLLFRAREQRVRPGLDDKVITEWNAMFVATLAEAGAATGRRDWLEAAETSAGFLLSALRSDQGRWLRSWQREAGARHLAYAADHAQLVDAFTRLAEATGRARWVAEARAVADALIELFHDEQGGGFFTIGHDGERLLVRSKDVFDGPVPSANSAAALALLRLGALTGEARYSRLGEGVLRLLAGAMAHQASAFGHALAALDLVVSSVTEVAVVGDRPDLVAAVQRSYLPTAVLAWGDPYRSPLWEGREPGKGYVCRSYACQAPASTVEEILAQLEGVAPPPSSGLS